MIDGLALACSHPLDWQLLKQSEHQIDGLNDLTVAFERLKLPEWWPDFDIPGFTDEQLATASGVAMAEVVADKGTEWEPSWTEPMIPRGMGGGRLGSSTY